MNGFTARHLVIVLLLGSLSLTGWAVSVNAGQTLVVAGFKNVTALVDVNLCSWTPTMCSDSGSLGVAAVGNDSVVGIYLHLATAGLAESAFSMTAITNPGGVSPVFVSTALCASCFAEPEPGVYRLAARPAVGNWSGGTYVAQVTVTKPAGGTLTVLIPIDIPF
jgi:hypothetical protein